MRQISRCVKICRVWIEVFISYVRLGHEGNHAACFFTHAWNLVLCERGFSCRSLPICLPGRWGWIITTRDAKSHNYTSCKYWHLAGVWAYTIQNSNSTSFEKKEINILGFHAVDWCTSYLGQIHTIRSRSSSRWLHSLSECNYIKYFSFLKVKSRENRSKHKLKKTRVILGKMKVIFVIRGEKQYREVLFHISGILTVGQWIYYYYIFISSYIII